MNRDERGYRCQLRNTAEPSIAGRFEPSYYGSHFLPRHLQRLAKGQLVNVKKVENIILPQWQPVNQTSSTSVKWIPPWEYWRSSSRNVFRRWGFSLIWRISPHLRPNSISSWVGRLKKLGLNRTRCSSSARAWRKCLTWVFTVVNGSRFGIIPTDPTVSLWLMEMRKFLHPWGIVSYHTAIISMSTSIEKAFLKAALCLQPVSSSRAYILYANGTCWSLDFGSSPTFLTDEYLGFFPCSSSWPYESFKCRISRGINDITV